jgi:hypothetical protein
MDELSQQTIAENVSLRVLLSEVSEAWVNGRRVLDGVPLTLANQIRRVLRQPSSASGDDNAGR